MKKRIPLYSMSGTKANRIPAGTVEQREIPNTAGRQGQERSLPGRGTEVAQTATSAYGPVITRYMSRHRYAVTALAAVGLALISVILYEVLTPDPMDLTQDDIDAAVMYTLESMPASPPPATLAYSVVYPSLVQVWTYSQEDESPDRSLPRPIIPGQEEEHSALPDGVGTGFVIEDSGLILTNHHVIDGAERIAVVFYDGFSSAAGVVGIQPENDIAILQAAVVPEGLVPATMASAAGLLPGEPVVVVGHPFGISNSVSFGVVSGVGRSYATPDGSLVLTNLIQFDAAVNPGNSGGPLLNTRGEVVGIVTSLLNPTEQQVFIGIGFAVTIDTAAAGLNPF